MKSGSHLIVAGSAWAARIVLALLQVASVRLLTVGLGQQSYAVYALLLGLSVWFTLADFGIAAALQNMISECRARAVDYSRVVGMWALIAMAGGGLLALLAWMLAPWLAGMLMASFDGVPMDVRVQALRIMMVSAIALASGSLIYKIWYGEQRGYLTHLCQLFGGVAAYASAALVLHLDVPHRLEWCAVAYFGINALLPMAVLLWRMRAASSPAAGEERILSDRVMRSALGFWGYGLMAALVLQLDYVLIAFVLGPDDLVAYSIYSRIFGLGFFVYTSVLGALWPVLSEKAAQGRGKEMNALVARHVALGLGFIVAFTAVVAIYDSRIIQLISPTLHVGVPLSFVLAMGAYFAVRVWSDTYAVMLQSMGQLRPFYMLVPAQAALSIGGQIVGSRLLGLAGVPLGMGLSFVLTVAWAAPHLARDRSLRLSAPL